MPQLNGQSALSAPRMTGTSLSPLEALAGELGIVAARIEREAKLQVAAALAEIRQEMSALRARAAESELRAVNAERERADIFAARLATVRDGADADPALVAQLVAEEFVKLPVPRDGKDADSEAVAEIAAKRVSAELTELIKADVEAIRLDLDAIGAGIDGKIADQISGVFATMPVPQNGDDGQPGIDGKDVDPAMIAEMVAVEVAKIPPAPPGKNADPEVVRRIVAEEVVRAAEALPRPVDGHTPTAEELAPILEEAAAFAVAALPRARDGEDGKSVDPADVERMVAAEVAGLPHADPEKVRAIIADLVEKAIADLPPPEPGAPGENIDPAEVEKMIRDEVEKAIAQLPPPEPGKSIDPADVADMIEVRVRGAVLALPTPKDGESVDPAEVRRMVAEAVAALPPPERGPEGPAGKLPIAKEWRDEVHYEGGVVTHLGRTFQARCDTGREPPHDDWLCLAEAGRDGPEGRAFEIRGTWNETESYQTLDVVALEGAAFVARHDSPGKCPGEGWQLMSRQGRAGPPGNPGTKGEKGNPGLPGSVTAARIDGEGLLTLTNGDGSTVALDLYPLLVKVQR